ncbi:MAG: hypothetical protein WCL06_08805 [Bacteroidota bacterium]
MSTKKLKKKTIVTSNQTGMTDSKVIVDSNDKIKAMELNDTIVPNPDPTAAAMQTKVDDVQKNVYKRDLALQEVKDITVQIKTGLTEIKGIFVDKWAKQIQNAIGDDIGKAKLLKFGIKGIDDGHAEPPINVYNSRPVILKIDVGTHLQHVLDIVNSETKKNPLPYKAKHTDVYALVSDVPPTDIKKMQYLGIAQKGKFTHYLEAADLGKTVWYIVVYVDKKSIKPQQLSVAEKATVV